MPSHCHRVFLSTALHNALCHPTATGDRVTKDGHSSAHDQHQPVPTSAPAEEPRALSQSHSTGGAGPVDVKMAGNLLIIMILYTI